MQRQANYGIWMSWVNDFLIDTLIQVHGSDQNAGCFTEESVFSTNIVGICDSFKLKLGVWFERPSKVKNQNRFRDFSKSIFCTW